MVVNIKTVNSTKFSINGLIYPKNFIPYKSGSNQLRIISKYDSRFRLIGNTSISDIKVDGVSYSTWAAISQALLQVIYAGSTAAILITSPQEGASFNEGDTITIETTIPE